MKPIAIAIALALAASMFGGGDKKKPEETKPDGGPLQVDEVAEAAACEQVAATRPTTWEGRARLSELGQNEAEWLATVAFRLAYGRWAEPDVQPGDAARLAAIATCVAGKITKLPPVNPVPVDPQNLPPINASPKPGGYYRISPALNALLKVSSAAYGTKSGTAANLAAAKKINADPRNARYRIPIDEINESDAAKTFDKNAFGAARITFSPVFPDFAAQLADAVSAGRGTGNEYAVIWIPE